ncbi:MAG TPA: energy transducer TonB [Edaphobacter sp.]|jgi:protein TonB|nr:energy transducer TonB [Edaphobacter sp.]
MFEDSLVESRVNQVSSSKRWTMLASIGLQVAVAGVVMVLPLLHPEAMPFRLEAPKVVMPLMPKPPVPVVVERESAASSSSVAIPSVTREAVRSLLPSLHPVVGDPPPLGVLGSEMRMTDALPSGIGVDGGTGPVVSVAPARGPVAPLQVSKGVLQGMLLAPIRPVYPVIAKAAGVQGTVIVEAVISRTGTIESLHVVSGPQMLQNAALEAIREARYQPFRLNGEPTDVQTTITVNFRLGG